MKRVNDILNFWFAGLNDQTLLDKKDPRIKRWFVKTQAFDDEIRRQFDADLVKASRGECQDWERTPHGALALIILFDQFSRNIYRNTPAMYATDSLALNLTRHAIDQGQDKSLQLVERIFLYMPFMHAEDSALQELSVKYFAELLEDSRAYSSQNTPYYQYTLLYAEKHRDFIKRFGRFPHRNAILKRISSSEEEKFLAQSGSSF